MKTTTKLLSILAIVAFLITTVLFVGCKTTATPETAAATTTAATTAAATTAAAETTAAATGPKTIALSSPGVSINAYTVNYTDYFNKKAKEMGYKTIVADAEIDAQKQANQIDSLIQQKPDVLIVWCLDVNAIVPSLKKAKEAGITVICTNTQPAKEGLRYIDAYTGPDDFTQGGIVATQAVKDLESKGLKEKGKIVQIIGIPGYSAFIFRQSGFESKLLELAPKVTILGTQPSQAKKEIALTVMENFITTFGKQINGVYCHDDFIAEGALGAIEAAGLTVGKDLFLWGLGGSSVGLKYVKDGKFTSTTNQQPTDDADLALKIADKLIKGEKVDFLNYLTTPIVTKDNVDQYLPGYW